MMAEKQTEFRNVATAHADFQELPALRRLSEKFSTGAPRLVMVRAVFWRRDNPPPATTSRMARLRKFTAGLRTWSLSAASVHSPARRCRSRAGERVLGAIMMVSVSTDRICGVNELSLAEELAQRAALALENARLYKVAEEARTEAERANLAKDRFLAMLSHELRTPLMPVLTSLLALEHDDLPDSVRDSLQMIRRNVELEARLIDDLLDLTRISKGKVQLSLEIVDAHVLLRNALEICQADIDQKHLALDLQLGGGMTQFSSKPIRRGCSRFFGT